MSEIDLLRCFLKNRYATETAAATVAVFVIQSMLRVRRSPAQRRSQTQNPGQMWPAKGRMQETPPAWRSIILLGAGRLLILEDSHIHSPSQSKLGVATKI